MGKIPMKRRLMLLLSLFVLGTAMLSAQKVNLNYSKATLRTVLESITEQTGHTLAFSKEVVNLNDEVTVREQNAELETVLQRLLTPRNIGYEIRENKIYIFDKSLATTESGQPAVEQVNLTGRVTDQNGEPVIGVNISIPGTTTGTVTDYDGYYALAVPKGSTLRFSYIGYLDREYTITNQTELNVQLLEDTEMLDELVVVGYACSAKAW